MRLAHGDCLQLFQGRAALGPVTSLHRIFLHLPVLEFCVFVSNSLVACKREERRGVKCPPEGPSRAHGFPPLAPGSYVL